MPRCSKRWAFQPRPDTLQVTDCGRRAQAPSQARQHPLLLMTFARVSRIPISGSKTQGIAERHYPEADVWLGERGYRAFEAEFKRINEFVQLARDTSAKTGRRSTASHAFARRSEKARDPLRSGQSGTQAGNAGEAKTTVGPPDRLTLRLPGCVTRFELRREL